MKLWSRLGRITVRVIVVLVFLWVWWILAVVGSRVCVWFGTKASLIPIRVVLGVHK